jgi:hypothetical protein
MKPALAAIAASQGGVFTRQQALAVGYKASQIRALIDTDWVMVHVRGIYAERALVEAVQADPERFHVLQGAARVRSSGLDHVLSHRTGVLVHELPLLGKVPLVPQMTRTPRTPSDTSRTPGLYVASLAPQDCTKVDGVAVTSLPRTACDVARHMPLRDGVVVADAVLRRLVPQDELVAAAQSYRHWPGGPNAAKVARFADGRAETPLESITRLAYAQEGLPAPETQIEIRRDGVFVALVDFLFRDQRTVGEADGMTKYDEPGALRLEKRREENIRRCGLEVVRNVWDDVWPAPGRRELAQRMRDAFAYAQDRPLAPGVTFRVPSLDELVQRRKKAA